MKKSRFSSQNLSFERYCQAKVENAKTVFQNTRKKSRFFSVIITLCTVLRENIVNGARGVSLFFYHFTRVLKSLHHAKRKKLILYCKNQWILNQKRSRHQPNLPGVSGGSFTPPPCHTARRTHAYRSPSMRDVLVTPSNWPDILKSLALEVPKLFS